MLYIYEYPDIRDVLMILTMDIFNGNDNMNKNTDLRGWAILTPRSPEASEVLQKFLDLHHVKFQRLPWALSEGIKFQYGQNKEIDDTVQQMYDDQTIKRVNRIIFRAKSHKIAEEQELYDEETQKAVNELKGLVTKVNEIQSENENETSYYYLYFTNIERAYMLMVGLGLWAEKHVSNADGKPVEVLRIPKDSVAGWGMGIIKELNKAAQTRQQENFEHGQGAFSKILALANLKTLINKVTRLSREEEAKPENIGKLSYCFYFDAGALDKAQELLQVLGMPTVRKEDNNGRTYLLYSVNADQLSEDSFNTIYTLDQVVLNREARARQNDDGLRRM